MKSDNNRFTFFSVTPTVILVLVVISLASCNKILGSDSGRAQELLEALINEPEQKTRLVEITLNQQWSAANILPAIHGQNTLRYLRARTKQNRSLEYKVSSKINLSNKRSYVEVAVVEESGGVLVKKDVRHLFRIFFKENNDGNNIITKCENLS